MNFKGAEGVVLTQIAQRLAEDANAKNQGLYEGAFR